MKVLWIHPYANTLYDKNGCRHYFLQKDLKKNNINISIVTCTKSHLSDRKYLNKNYSQHNFTNEDKDKFIWIKGLSSSRNLILRLLNLIYFNAKLFFFLRREKFDIIVGSSPDPISALTSYLVSIRFRKKYVLEVRDIWPETLIQVHNYSKLNIYIIFLKKIMRFLYRHNSLIISSLPYLHEYLSYNNFEKKIVYVPNYSADNYFKNKDIKFYSSSKIQVLYAGSLGEANDIPTIIRTIEEINIHYEEKFNFVFYGSGYYERQIIKLSKKYSNVEYFESKSYLEILDITKKFHLGIISWKDCDVYKYGISPNKIPSYLSRGLPIIMSANFNHEILEYNAGYISPAGDHISMSKNLIRYFKLKNNEKLDLSQNAIFLCNEKFNSSPYIDKLTSSFNTLNK